MSSLRDLPRRSSRHTSLRMKIFLKMVVSITLSFTLAPVSRLQWVNGAGSGSDGTKPPDACIPVTSMNGVVNLFRAETNVLCALLSKAPRLIRQNVLIEYPSIGEKQHLCKD
jgi:hypothetical protein